jgi:hypothetical protein
VVVDWVANGRNAQKKRLIGEWFQIGR